MKKIGLLVLSVVIVLGSLGVGYAKWSDTVNISGSISSGNVCVKWVQIVDTNDNCNTNTKDWHAVSADEDGDPIPFTYGTLLGTTLNPPDSAIMQGDKDVGCSSAVIQSDPKIILVTLYNTYPSYCVDITTHLKNCGSIPIKRSQISITYTDPDTGEPVTLPLPDGTVVQIPGIDSSGNISPIIEVLWGNNTGHQLEPGANEEDSFYIHVLQAAKQSFSYSFTLNATGVQWNEYP